MLITVPPDRVAAVWPLASPLLEPAIRLSDGRHRPEHVLAALADARQQLWLWLDGDAPVFAAVTEIIDYPGKRVLAVPWVGGLMSRDAVGALMAAGTGWGRTLGCAAIEACGRRGWARMAGLKAMGVALQRDLGQRDIGQWEIEYG